MMIGASRFQVIRIKLAHLRGGYLLLVVFRLQQLQFRVVLRIVLRPEVIPFDSRLKPPNLDLTSS